MPKLEQLSYYVEAQASIVPGSKSTGAVTPTAVDGSGGYDRIRHVIALGSFGTGGVFDCEITESATTGGTYTLITGSGITALTAASANKLVIVDAPVNNAKPFQKIRGTVSTAAIGICAIAECYNGTRPLGSTQEDVAEEVTV